MHASIMTNKKQY